MTKTHRGAGLRRLKGIIAARAATGLSDAELLERFVGRREEAAFAALVERHGPMVLRVGWATLHQLQDAEDVFQATFLVLARRASTVRKQASLGSWLHGVAYRLALKLSARAAARRRREAARSAPATTNADALTCREMESMLHEELHRLPERLRAPLVLCYLEGKTRDEAAARLGVPVGTLKGRLEKGRERLRNALVRRGVTPALAAAALTLSHDLLTAAVPERLTLATVQAAGLFVENQTLAGSMTTAAAALANEMSHSLTCSKAPTLAGLLLAGGLIACCALYYPAASEPAQQKARPTEASTPVVTTKADAQGDPLPDGAIARLGSLRWRHGGEARSLAFSADGKTLAVASREDGIYFFETTTGRVVRRLPINAQLVAYAPTKPLLAAMDDTGVVSLHDANNEKPMLLKGKATQQRCLVFSADSKYLAAVDRDARVVIWDVERGMPTAELVGHNHGNPQFLFSPDGLVLALGAVNPKVQFWDARTGKLLRGFEPDVELVLSLAYAPDGRSIAVGGRNNIVIAEAATGKELQRFEADKMNGVLGVAFTPDGKTIVSGSEDAKLRVWDVASGKERFVLDSRGWLGRSLAVSRDGKLAAMGTVYSVIRLFDVTTGRQVSPEPEAHDAAVHAVAVSSDGKLVASGGENQQLRLWDASGQPLRRIHASAKSVSFAPDGRRLASTWLWNKQVRVWDAQDGKEVYKLRRDGDHETATVGFSSDGKTIASTGLIQRADKDSPWLTELRVWDALSGKKIRTVDNQEPVAVLRGPVA